VPAGQLLIKFKSKQEMREIEREDIAQTHHTGSSSNFKFFPWGLT